MLTLLLIPSSAAVPDLGAAEAVEQARANHALLGDATVPCNEQGIVWNGMDDPMIAAAVQATGHHVCDKLMLDATVTLVTSANVLSVDTSDDGQLTLRIIFPLIRTPILIPLRNQDTSSEQFIGEASRDLGAPIAQWVPYMLDLNRGPPCADAIGAPSSVTTTPPGLWTIHSELCGDVAAELPPIVATPGGVSVGNALTVAPPRTVASVERIFLLRVRGLIAGEGGSMQTIYEETLLNVAVVNNVATERLGALEKRIEQTGHRLRETTLVVDAFLTEADYLAGSPLTTPVVARVPEFDGDSAVLITLQPSEDSLSTASSGGCNPSIGADGVYLTFENGCLKDSAAVLVATDRPAEIIRNSHANYALNGNDFAVGEHVAPDGWFDITAMGGFRSRRTAAATIAETVAWRFIDGGAVKIESIWEIRGDVNRRCDPGSERSCVATGATLITGQQVIHKTPDRRDIRIAQDARNIAGPDSHRWCAPEAIGPQIYSAIAQTVGCFVMFIDGSYERQTQGFNSAIVASGSVVDTSAYPGALMVTTDVSGSVCCTTLTNIPGLDDMRAHFIGVRISRV